jgi:hypothetical protein
MHAVAATAERWVMRENVICFSCNSGDPFRDGKRSYGERREIDAVRESQVCELAARHAGTRVMLLRSGSIAATKPGCPLASSVAARAPRVFSSGHYAT